MAKKMLINVVHPEEARVAIVQEGLLVELDIEIAGSEQTRGNVYKGVVVRVEPGLQAAFIDIGLKKLGFLQMGELHPDYWQWRDDVPEEQRKRRPRVQEVLRRGQELIVQVEKGERDMKGAALTTYLSHPGRYMVIMPGSDSAGISRKVEAEADRKKLKEMAAQLEIPEGIGYIIRTEALGKTKTELTKDFKTLLKLNKELHSKAAKTKAPALIYQELDLVIRTIRDYFTAEIDEVLVDSPDVYEQAREFFKKNMPKFEQLVKLHQEKRPIFSKYQLEEQIDQIHEKKVPLKSGGSIVIEPTEALVTIDVNSGKSTGEKGVEDTAFKTNMEAAEEAARQLRLRDLGGLIVIDFIDMRDKKHMIEVEKTLKNALKADKARVTVGRISQFGMLEMSRQRIKASLSEGNYLNCPHCEGRGKVKSVENMAISFLRKVHAAAAKGTVGEVRGSLPLEVAYYLLNRKKRELAQIEDDYEIEVTVKGKTSFLMNQMELELDRREKPQRTEAAEEVAGVSPLLVPVPAAKEGGQPESWAAPAGEEGKGKKKRRRKKKGHGEHEPTPLPEHAMAASAESLPAATSPVAADGPGELNEEPTAEEHKKKRRRRKKKGSGEHEPVASLEQAEAVSQELAAPLAIPVMVAVEGEEPHAEPGTDEHKKKRRRRKKRGAKAHAPELDGSESTGGIEELESGAPGLETEPDEPGTPVDEHKKKRRRRKKRGAKTQIAEGLVSEVPHGEVTQAAPDSIEAAPMAAEVSGSANKEASPEEHGKKKRRRKRGGAKPAAVDSVIAEGPAVVEKSTIGQQIQPVVAGQVPAVAGKPEKKARPTRKKPPVPVQEKVPAQAAVEAPAEKALVAPKKARVAKPAPRKVAASPPVAAVAEPVSAAGKGKAAKAPKVPAAPAEKVATPAGKVKSVKQPKSQPAVSAAEPVTAAPSAPKKKSGKAGVKGGAVSDTSPQAPEAGPDQPKPARKKATPRKKVEPADK